MDTEDPRWPEYERRFRALAESVHLKKGPQAELGSARAHLFLYGENGLAPEDELATLAVFEQARERLRGLEMVTSYWEDIALYLPGAP